VMSANTTEMLMSILQLLASYVKCAEHPEEFSILSCDSKAKVHIGGQAVSRYHHLRVFFSH
jgi:hypothetical protein